MNIGVITQPNEKGQIVIPKSIRDSLGINKNVPLNIIQRGNGIYIYPVEDIIHKSDDNRSLYEYLKKSQGAWAGDDWPDTEKRRHRIEKRAAKRRREEKW